MTGIAFTLSGRIGSGRRRWPPAAVLLAALLAPVAGICDDAPAKAAPAEKLPPFETVRGGLVRHTGAYQPLAVSWQGVGAVKDANGIFPHPAIPDRAVLATASGLRLTEDGGQTWQALPQGGADTLGAVNDIAFRTDQADTFYVASRTRGVWVTTDNGRTFRQIGSKAAGMAADTVVSIEIYAHDQAGRTLLVSHGDAAPGLSRSVDAGRTWTVLFPDYHVHRILTTGRTGQDIFIVAASRAEPDSQRLFVMPSLTEAWQEMARDIVCTGLAAPRLRQGWALVSTADRGILRITGNGGVVRNVAPGGETDWAAVGSTWGATADSQVVYAYEPRKLGLVVLNPAAGAGEDGAAALADTRPVTASDGLLACAVVREGAQLRANANGTVFYACVNSLLYRGVRIGGATPIQSVVMSPPVCRVDPDAAGEAVGRINAGLRGFNSSADIRTAAAGLRETFVRQDAALAYRRVVVTARFDAAAPPPRQVTVDLSRLSLSARTPMLPAGGGVYTAAFSVDPQRAPRQNEDWRQPWPGPIGLTVTAVSDAGELNGAVGVLSIAETFSGCPFVSRLTGSMTNVEAGEIRLLGYGKQVMRRTRPISGFRVDQPGPWRLGIFRGWGGEALDISSFQTLSFWIRTRDESAEDISLQLRDSPSFGYPVTTPPLALIKNGFLPEGKFTGRFQRVVVPVERLIGNAEGFQPSVVRTLVFSGTAGKPVDYFIDGITFHVTSEVPAEDEEEAP